MDSTEYNPDKKAMPIIGLILMVIGLIGYIVYLITSWFLKIIPDTGMQWIFFGIVVVIIIIGAVLCEMAKKKKYGSYKLTRIADVLSWAFIIVLIIGLVLKFFIHL